MEYGLSLGSNLEPRLDNIMVACELIAAIVGVRIEERATVYETVSIDVPQEYEHLSFLNTILIIETELEANILHAKLQEIENRLGRVRGEIRNAPRPIDIDLIYAEGITSNTEKLILPHPRWAERRFVVEPLAEVRPDLMIYAAKGTVSDVLLSLQGKE